MAGTRLDVLALLQELAQLTILDEGNPQSFRARAYERAVEALRNTPSDIERMSVADLTRLQGVGKATALKVREFFASGQIEKLEKLRALYPPAYVRLSHISGLGPKTLAKLRDELGVKDLDDLRRAIAEEKIRALPGLGARSEEKIARAIERLGLGGKEHRTPIATAMSVARRLLAELGAMSEVERVAYAGSLRRQRESVGDIDILVASNDPQPIMARFTSSALAHEVLGHGETKSSIVTPAGLQVDLRVVAPAAFGAALMYFTGSKAHNIKLRQLALQRGWTLNEYALTEIEGGVVVVAAASEEEIYRALGLPFIPAPMREDSGEIEAARDGALPRAPALAELRGDLHVHTDLSGDGRSSLEEIVAAAEARGLEYLALTDHAENLALNGVSRDQLRDQRRKIEALQARTAGLRLLQGAELNIGADGGLDYDLSFRLGLDWCVAAVHSHFDLDREAQTRRVLAAMRDPSVHVIGHLTGRKIGHRPGIELDIGAVLDAAGSTGTAIEINCSLSRLDAAADVIRQGRERGVRFIVSTDSHHTDDFARAEWGVRQAQRGWLGREHIVNALPRPDFLSWAAGVRAGKGAAGGYEALASGRYES